MFLLRADKAGMRDGVGINLLSGGEILFSVKGWKLLSGVAHNEILTYSSKCGKSSIKYIIEYE